MKHLAIILTLSAVGISSAHGNTTFTTHDSKGASIAVFTQVQGPGSFGLAWKDPSGKVWSNYQGDFDNIAITPDLIQGTSREVTRSQATDACTKIGGNLPHIQDIEKLKTYFEFFQICPWSHGGWACNQDTMRPTKQADKDLDAIFPNADMGFRNLWTKDVVTIVRQPYNYENVYYVPFLAGPHDNLETGAWRGAKMTVICIAP